ncbi:MAG TPA: anthrone oxygenase family protein [Acidimicrobiales bacterium]
MDRSLPALTVVTAVGSGVVGGVFFAFSAFVMRALDRLPARQGLAAMQSINVMAPTAPLMILLVGTALCSLVLGGSALFRLDEAVARYQLAGAALYLLAVAITGIYHVPRNDALTALDPSAADAVARWRAYIPGWVLWNHVRTATSVAGAVLLTVAGRIG